MNFLAFLSSIVVVCVSTYGVIKLKMLDKKNTLQHALGTVERSETESKLLGKLESIHGDVQETAHRVGQIDGKLTAHIEDRNAHDSKLTRERTELMQHGDAEWATSSAA